MKSFGKGHRSKQEVDSLVRMSRRFDVERTEAKRGSAPALLGGGWHARDVQGRLLDGRNPYSWLTSLLVCRRSHDQNICSKIEA